MAESQDEALKAQEEMWIRRIKASSALVLDEYIMCQSSADAAMSVDELGSPDLRCHLVKAILRFAMDKDDAGRGMANVLLSSLVVRGALEATDVEEGLEMSLASLADTAVDVPRCHEYVSESIAHFLEDKVVPEAFLGHVKRLCGEEAGATILAKLSQLQLPFPLTIFKGKVKEIVDEYLVSGELGDALEQLADLKEPRWGHEVVKRIVVTALEKKNAERESASVLLSGLTRTYGSEQFFEGFIRTLRGIDDLALDTPNVCPLLANFIARAIADDVLPPAFINLVPKRFVEWGRGADVASLVKGLLQVHGNTGRIMNVWGVGARKSVEELKESVRALVEEYYVEGVLDEAVRCVHELGVPHFGHEVVKRAVYGAIERGEKEMRMALELFKRLQLTKVMDHVQLTKGMQRCVAGLPDLSLDVPNAPERLRQIADWLSFEDLISPSIEQAVLLKAKEGSGAKLTVEGVHVHAVFVAEEYIVSESSRDACQSIEELNAGDLTPELVFKIVTLSMDKAPKEREMLRGLVTSLVLRGAVSSAQVEAGLDILLRSFQDLKIDVPRLEEYFAHAAAHFIEDQTIPESFLSTVPLLIGEESGGRVKELVGKELELPLPITVFKGKVKEIIADFYANPDPREAAARLDDLKEPRWGHEVVKRIVVTALEKKNAERESASVLLSGLTRTYGSEQFFEGFIRTLRGIDDLALDTPNVCPLLANFIARAIADDCLPPIFISLVPKKVVEVGKGAEVASLVKNLLEQHGSSERIMNVWGVGARRSVEELKESVRALVEEYYVEGVLDEAVRCVHELGVPHFGHEVVKRAVYQAVERRDDAALKQACSLITALTRSGDLDSQELTKGMSRALRGLPDLSLDVPDAASRMDTVIQHGVNEGILAKGFREHLTGIAASVAVA